MKILSWNVNGLRAVYKRNFLEWLKRSSADIICLQEIRARKEQLSSELTDLEGYHSYFNSAKKDGYSGVAVYTKIKAQKITSISGFERFDEEGRFLECKFKNLILINLYLPHGGRDKKNLTYKLKAYAYLLNYLKRYKNKQVILCGDFNVAHQEIDLARPKNNVKNIMFTFDERECLDRLIELGFIDTFRKFYREGGYYTWWPYIANARQRNIGWRIDYIFTSQSITPLIRNTFILKEITGSDHCPIGIEIMGIN